MSHYGVSYASRKFSRRYGPMTANGMRSGMFNGFRCYTESDVSQSFRKLCGRWWYAPQGGGYWMWKIGVLIDAFRHMKKGDLLTYVDSGCHINSNPPSRQRFREYTDMVNRSESGFLRFQLAHQERHYTNKKTVEYFKKRFDVSDEKESEYLDTGQLVGGIMMLKKCDWTIRFLNTALAILTENPALFTNYYSTEGETHRHDQSILSMLYKHMGGDLVLADETYFPGGGGGFGTPASQNKPFWACRIN